MGFPPKTFLGRLGGQPAALPQPQHGDCSPLLASGPSGPQFLMETFLAAARSWGSSTSIPPSPRLRQRPLPPPGCPCVCLPFTVPPGGSAHRSFPVPFFPGAHLAPLPEPGSLEPRPPPSPAPAPGRIQFEASQDIPGPLVLG